MESLNLNTLANSLPAAQQNAEKELLNDFKAAALSITTLYRSSRKNGKRAYNAGYAAACQDLLNFIQQGVSASDIGQAPSGSSHDVEGDGMTIGRVMDWTEARVEAIKAREEEEDEDEEREKDKERAAPPPRPAIGRAVTVPAVLKSDGKKAIPLPPSTSSNRLKETVATSLPTPNSPVSHSSTQTLLEPSSPSPPPSGLSSRPAIRPTKSRPTPAKEASQPAMSLPHTHSPALLSEHFSPATPVSFPEPPIVIGAGAKRRHAVMMMLDNPTISIGGPSSTVSSPGGIASTNNSTYAGTAGSGISRRRTRSTRNLTQLQPHNPNIQMNPEDMDVEEDGRERKRVARR